MSKESKVMSVDLGWENLNAYNGKDDFICPATFAEKVDKLEAGYQVVHEFSKYLIGDPTVGYSRGIKKELLQHKLMMYLAISQCIEDATHVSVVVSCPIDIYLNKAARVSFKNFLTSRKEVTIDVDGKPEGFIIDRLEVMAEGAGIMYRNPAVFSEKTVGIVDIGGGTINFLYTNDLNIIREQSFSEVMGVHYLRTKIRDSLKKNGIVVNDLEINELLKEERYVDIITPVINAYMIKIKKCISDHEWSKHVGITFTGGGTLLLKDKIIEYFPDSTVSTTPLIDNVYGNYQIGVLLWQKE